LLNRRGVGEDFLAQVAQRLQDPREVRRAGRALDWMRRVAPHLAEIQTRLPAAQAADNLSDGKRSRRCARSATPTGPTSVSQTSVPDAAHDALAGVRQPSATTRRDRTLHAIEKLAKKTGKSERSVAGILLGLME
jgi:cyclic beta-1,2-glucan synthetase